MASSAARETRREGLATTYRLTTWGLWSTVLGWFLFELALDPSLAGIMRVVMVKVLGISLYYAHHSSRAHRRIEGLEERLRLVERSLPEEPSRVFGELARGLDREEELEHELLHRLGRGSR